MSEGRPADLITARCSADSLPGCRRSIERLAATTRRLERWGAERGWIGPDPYEGLNARRLSLIKRWPLGRRILIQAVKRSPLDLRGVLGIEGHRSSAAMGHLLSAYARLHLLGDGSAGDRIVTITRRLAELRLAGFEMSCWGYHFDVETRFFFYPSNTPNAIATAFVGLGLLDAHAAIGDAGLLDRAEETGTFFLEHIPQTATGEGAFFGYLPGDRTPIHNANLLICGLLARLGRLSGRADFLDAARAGVQYTLEHQRADGSWPYAETTNGRWVDNFHTGYVLDSLLRCGVVLEDDAIWRAYEDGLAFYADRLFLADGAPKFFADRLHPIDGQCVSQAIHTFSVASMREPAWLDWAWRVYEFAVRRMQRSDGAFLFQRGRLLVNPTPTFVGSSRCWPR